MINRLPPSSFHFGNYNANIPFRVYVDDKLLLQWLQKNHIVGYGTETEIRPRPKEIAIMIEIVDNQDRIQQYWNHISKRVWEKYLESLELKL